MAMTQLDYCCAGRHGNPPGKMWCATCESLIAGTQIGDYKVVSHIGYGTFSAVYLAEQQSLHRRKVVIKVLHQAWNSLHMENFEREAALLASLSHPYILPIYAYGLLYEQPPTHGVPYLVLPYAEQGSLQDAFVREGKRPWSIDRVVSMSSEVAEALDYAHVRGVLHRDVKPANLLQMGSHVLLSDFSVSSFIDADTSHLSVSWAGSPAYMAPEVWGYRPGRYSDQYALAVTCYYLLTGELPWRKKGEAEGSARDWSNMHCFVVPRALEELRLDLPVAVNIVLQRALAKDPHERYPTVQAFATDLLVASQDETRDSFPWASVLKARPDGTKLRLAPMDAGTGGKAWRDNKGKAASSVSGENWEAGSRTGLVSDWTGELARANMVEREPLAETSLAPARAVRWGAEASLSTDPLANPPPGDKWPWWALLLNVLICILLAVGVYWQSGGIGPAGNLLLSLWPAMFLGPVVARRFQRMRLTTISWAICWWILFGITDVLISACVCYIWTALILTIPHWGHDWLQPGDGLRIFFAQIWILGVPTLELLVVSLWMAVICGAVVGILNHMNYNGNNNKGISISSGVSPP